jgi:hypothetical protein
MSGFEYFSCTIEDLHSIHSPVDLNLLMNLYCDSEFYFINYVDIFYRNFDKSFLLVFLLMVAVWYVLLAITWRLNKQILVHNIIQLKDRMDLSPFLMAVLLLAPLNQFPILVYDEVYIEDSDYHVMNINFILSAIMVISGISLPLLLIFFKKTIVLPFYATHLCIFFTIVGLAMIWIYTIIGEMSYVQPVLHMLMYGLFVYLSFWAKDKDEAYLREIAEREGYIDEIQNTLMREEVVSEEDGLNDVDELFGEAKELATRLEKENRDRKASGITDEGWYQNEGDSKNEENSNDSFEGRVKKRAEVQNMNIIDQMGSGINNLLNLTEKVLEIIFDPAHGFFKNLVFLPLNAFIIVAVPYSANPIMSTAYKHIVVFLACLIIVINKLNFQNWMSYLLALCFTVAIGLACHFIKAASNRHTVYNILSFVQVITILHFIDKIWDDSFTFFQFYFSLNKAVTSGFFLCFKYGIMHFISSFWLLKANEPELAVFNFYVWPVFLIFVPFAVWTFQGVLKDNKVITFFKAIVPGEHSYYDKNAMALIKFLFLFVSILYMVKTFYYFAVGMHTTSKMAKVYLAISSTFLCIGIPFAFSVGN